MVGFRVVPGGHYHLPVPGLVHQNPEILQKLLQDTWTRATIYDLL